MKHNNLRAMLYGLGELGPSALDIFLKVYLLLYFNLIMGLSPSLTSLAIGLGVLWDALIDPWIGIKSDQYYQKKGHRKLLLYSAVFLMLILFLGLWRIPYISTWVTFTALFLISSFLNSAISLYSVPFIAVANDLIEDNRQRQSWIGWRLAFFNIGSFVGLVVPAYYLTRNTVENSADPYLQATMGLALITLVCALVANFSIYAGLEPSVRSDAVEEHRFDLFKLIRDKKFLQMMLSYFVVNCGLGLNSALALYYYKNYLGFTEKQTQAILVGFLFVFTLSIPLWVLLTRFFDKKKLIVTGAFLMGLLTVLSFPHYQGVDFKVILSLASGLGGIFVGVAVVLEIYLSDFIKDKETETRQNVAGQYLGVWKMSAKVSRAASIALAGPILENANSPQTLANYFGWGVGLFFILSALIMIPSAQKRITN